VRVLTYAGYNSKTKSILWVCQCDCGERTVIRSSSLVSGHVQGCGCRLGHPTHHASGTPTYVSWAAMKDRCLNPKSTSYVDYGGRGITICKRWLDSFDNFLADMGPRPRSKSIDRINVNGNYERRNCRWATKQMQAKNQRRNSKPAASAQADVASFAVEEPF